MAIVTRIDAKAYYNVLPSSGHQCGDIWRGLPSFGLLGDDTCAGIVITPACDLSWQKSDTLTYLPLIPIRSYFSLDAALPAVIERLEVGLKASGYPTAPNWSAKTYLAPTEDELGGLATGLASFSKAEQRSQKVLNAIERVQACLNLIRAINLPDIKIIDQQTLSSVFGAEWEKIKDKIIRNSYSPSLHFFPKDNQNAVFSGVVEHSLALFRCPISVPVKVLKIAEEVSESSWQARLADAPVTENVKAAFAAQRPVKLLSLNSSFLSDLLTRFSALYNRVGSPDFTDETVNIYSQEVDF